MTAPRPNIVLIMSDQHNRAVAGCYGDPVVSTPNLDSLAARGVTFDSAYCPFPLCAPTRAAFMAGREPSTIGMYDNSCILPSDVPTFAHALGAAGYDVILSGRMHFNGPDQRHGFRERIFPEVSGHAVGDLGRTMGFHRTSLEKSGPGRNHYLLYDDECTAAAAQWLRHRGEQERPYCLVVGLVGPHCPFVCPRELFDKYFDAVSVPEYSEGYFASQHSYIRRMRGRSGITDATEHEIRRTRAAYYGMIEFDDRMVGRILGALGETGEPGDTAVIYTSDHGDMAGEHGLWWKMSFYDGSAGVPLIASWPSSFREGVRESTPASLTDLAPTLAEIAGAEPIPGATGRSLVPLLTGEGGVSERGVVSELFADPSVWVSEGPSGGPARMLRKGPWKCIYYHCEAPALFNLAQDPDELVDRAGDPACASLLREMISEILRDWDPEALQADHLRVVRERALVSRAPGDGKALQGEYWLGPEGYGYVEKV